MTIRYNIALDEDGNGTVTVFGQDGAPRTIDQTHPNFAEVIDLALAGEDPTDLLDIRAKIVQLDARVSIEDNTIHFDGEPLHNSLSDTILRYHREGRDTTRLVKFMENLASNPSRRSREQLFDWVNVQQLVIDEDGYFIGYKGVTQDLKSLHSGSAFVDGTKITGAIPYEVGSIVTMDRHQVQDDPNVGCSHGLHVGSWNYASGFGRTVLEVRVNPRDVVSVPVECSFQKLRCCRLEVLAVHETDEDDVADKYEGESSWDDWDSEDRDVFEELEPLVPRGFFLRLLERLKGN